MERKEERIAALVTAADRLGRKFETTDLLRYPKLIALANDWLKDQPMPSPDSQNFTDSMWWQVNAGNWLTNGQAKGVLNVIVARARYEAARAQAPAPRVTQAPAHETPLGTFTVVGIDASHITIRLQKPQDKAKAADGLVYAKYLNGADNDVDFQYFASVVNGSIRARGFERQVAALKVVLGSSGSELGKMGLAYALASSNCFYCGRTLTVPASIHSGMGPDCAAKHGGFYGETKAPEASAPEPTPAATEPTPAPARNAYTEADAANKAVSEHMAAVRASGRKLTYADVFPEDEELPFP